MDANEQRARETVADVLNELHGWNDGPMLC